MREIGAASTVLLKNTGGALPLKKPRNIVLVGSDAGPGKVGPNEFADQVSRNEFHSSALRAHVRSEGWHGRHLGHGVGIWVSLAVVFSAIG